MAIGEDGSASKGLGTSSSESSSTMLFAARWKLNHQKILERKFAPAPSLKMCQVWWYLLVAKRAVGDGRGDMTVNVFSSNRAVCR